MRLAETRSFLTNLDPGSITAAELLQKVPGHWGIESSLFFLKDRWWDEDRHWTRRLGVAEWLTPMTTAATTALRLLGSPGLPIRGRSDEIAWRPALGLAILGLA